MALAGVILSIIGTGIALAAFIRDALLRRKLTLAAVAPLLRPELERAREFFTEAAENGSRARDVAENYAAVHRRLGELLPGVRDSELRSHLGTLLQRGAWVSSNAPNIGGRVYGSGPTPQRYLEQDRQQEETKGPAREAEQAAARALERLSQLQSLAG